MTARPLNAVFLSYAGPDRAIAATLSDDLRDRGVATWWDQNLTPGSNWRDEIFSALDSAAAVIVIVTPTSIRSTWVTAEWSNALGSSKRVIPVLADGARVQDLPDGLSNIQAVDLNQDYAQAVDVIVHAVATLRRSDEPPPTASVDFVRLVEDVVDRKLASLRVESATPRPGNQTDPALVFVITSFRADMEPAFEAIHAAARSVGLRAERVKDVPGDYRITDRILDSIGRAALVVADLTHESPNVYFELGFARGLGKIVITIMRSGTRAHFDVQDWTYLEYIDSRPLERDLTERFRYEVDQRSRRD